MAKKNRNVLLVSVLFFLAAGGGSYLFREPILTRVATFLVVSDPLHKADAMEILGGGEPGRARKAAELYHEGWAPRIFITKAEHTTATEELRHYGISAAEDHEIKCAVLRLLGVPEDALEVVDGYNRSTLEEARRLRDYTEKRGLKRLILVTSNFHTRRTRLVFRRVFKGTGIDLMVQAAPPDDWFNPDKWWTRRMDSRNLFLEYQKLIFYAVRYW
ncbi:MAG: hypothetical protein DMG10_02490 [Acidobacteria bacterium]|nr:MAG: hypothetical protein DMG10_02490 [Acidobacteriota bacterium]PYV43818.1 MAG: hypothetical protein DMG09_00070 [Acidobacteriota bacterium]